MRQAGARRLRSCLSLRASCSLACEIAKQDLSFCAFFKFFQRLLVVEEQPVQCSRMFDQGGEEDNRRGGSEQSTQLLVAQSLVFAGLQEAEQDLQ